MSRVLVVANREKDGALDLAEAACLEARALGHEAVLSVRQGEDLSVVGADKVVVFGGDGTVLGAIAGLGESVPPVVAFNVGRLGYLAENPPERMREVLALALADRLEVSARCMIEAEIRSPGGSSRGGRCFREFAMNEIVLSNRENRRQLLLSVRVDGEALMDLRGDGLILATPTGSTAYSLSAGGPVLSPEMSAVLLTPLCPHQLAIRPLVLGAAKVVEVSHDEVGGVAVSADGRLCGRLEKGEELRVRVSPRTVRFLYLARGRYRLLREKLGWGWDEQRQTESVRAKYLGGL